MGGNIARVGRANSFMSRAELHLGFAQDKNSEFLSISITRSPLSKIIRENGH